MTYNDTEALLRKPQCQIKNTVVTSRLVSGEGVLIYNMYICIVVLSLAAIEANWHSNSY